MDVFFKLRLGNVFVLYTFKTKSLWFPGGFKGYIMKMLARNDLNHHKNVTRHVSGVSVINVKQIHHVIQHADIVFVVITLNIYLLSVWPRAKLD